MAFLRKKKQKSGTYLSICENYRDEKGKVRQKILYKLEKADYCVMKGYNTVKKVSSKDSKASSKDSKE